MSYFDVLEKDTEFVIMFINYLLEKSEESPKEQANVSTNTATPKKVRVNDDTATGGWW